MTFDRVASDPATPGCPGLHPTQARDGLHLSVLHVPTYFLLTRDLAPCLSDIAAWAKQHNIFLVRIQSHYLLSF